MTQPRIAVIAGSTGLVGGLLLQKLQKHADYSQVIAITRQNFNDWQAPVDDAYCALGTTIKKAGSQEAFRAVDHDLILKFARKAKENGAKRFILVSSVGADEQSRIFYSRVKGETERDLQKLGYETLLIFRPSLLQGARKENRLGEKLALTILSPLSALLVGPLKNLRPTSVDTLTQSMIHAALTQPQSKTYEPDGI